MTHIITHVHYIRHAILIDGDQFTNTTQLAYLLTVCLTELHLQQQADHSPRVSGIPPTSSRTLHNIPTNVVHCVCLEFPDIITDLHDTPTNVVHCVCVGVSGTPRHHRRLSPTHVQLSNSNVYFCRCHQ